MEEAEKVGARLKAVREELALTQRDLARSLKIGPNAWQIWESGKNIPTGENLLKIAELGFNPGWILTGKGAKRLADVDSVPQADSEALEAVPSEFSKNSLGTEGLDMFGRVLEAMKKAYEEAGVRISTHNLGMEALGKYGLIMTASQNPEDWPAMLKVVILDLQIELRKPITASNNGKASA